MAFAPSIKLTTPRKEQSPVAVQRGLPNNHRYRPAPRFVYVHYPTNWEFDLVEGFVPRLSKIVAKPGVNGVGENLSLTGTLAHLSAKGATYIDPKDIRLEDYQDYVRYYECDGGAKWYVDFCESATVLPNDEVLWDTGEEVQAQWLSFRAAVRDSGIISPMLVQVYDAIHARQKREVNSLGARIHMNPQFTHRYDEAVQTLADMEAAWGANNAKLAKAVKAKKPKGTAKKKTTKRKPKLTPPTPEEATANG